MKLSVGPGAQFVIGKLYVQTWTSFKRVRRVWLPNSFHVWWGDLGLHVFAFPFGYELERSIEGPGVTPEAEANAGASDPESGSHE